MLPKYLLVFLAVYFISDLSYGQKDKKFFRKDYTYIESEQSFYKIHTTGRTFAEAKRMCDREGATLYYAENVAEVNAVASFWIRNQPAIPWVFVGLTDEMAEGLFETIDRRPITEVYSRWQRFKPDNAGGNEDCVHMDVEGTMNDYLCDSKANFICKKTLQSLQWNNDCNMPYLDYTKNMDTGKCYKLHTTPLNWADAYATCRTEYTSLAVISNRMEADHLAKLTNTAPKLRLSEQYQRGIYHMGFHNKFKNGWQTVEGTPMNVDTNAWFDNYRPDGNHNEECGSMFFNGRLINTDCNTKSLFICEHKVDSGAGANSTTAINDNEENYY